MRNTLSGVPEIVLSMPRTAIVCLTINSFLLWGLFYELLNHMVCHNVMMKTFFLKLKLLIKDNLINA